MDCSLLVGLFKELQNESIFECNYKKGECKITKDKFYYLCNMKDNNDVETIDKTLNYYRYNTNSNIVYNKNGFSIFFK